MADDRKTTQTPPNPPNTTVTPIKDGPLTVRNLESFENSRGEPIALKKVAQLCRCGASKNKPFCDGSHQAAGFTDEKDESRQADALDRYPGKELTLLDNRGTCAHAGFCTSGLPAVWRMGVEPWIDPDGASADEMKAIIRTCPSGALAWEEGGEVHDAFHPEPSIRVDRDGPFQVRGGVALEEVKAGEGASAEHYALCRCGASRNKPFCDGSHWYVGFRDDEAQTISKANRRDDGELAFVAVGSVDAFEEGRVHRITVGDRVVALVRDQDGFHALNDACPHQGGPLSEGTVCEGAVRCPWHGFDFSLKTGKGVDNEHRAETLEVREREGQVEVAVPAPKHSTWTTSHVAVETMVAWGIDTVFGMVGHSNLGLAEAIRVQEARGKIRYFGIRHEGAAAFAASGYAKLTGKPAACLAIAGPGATNLLTGLWDAKVDRAPVLALTGQVNTQVLGPGAFQEIDLASAFEAVARFSQTVLPGSDVAELTNLALKKALIHRDVAHLIFPDEVQVQDAGEAGPGRPEGRVATDTITPPAQAVAYAAYRIQRAKRPIIIVGHGARQAMPEVIALAEELGAPVLTTFKAKGQLPDAHPLAAGVLGRSGTPVASTCMNQSDLLLVFGASFAAHTGIDAQKPIVQVDFDREALGKFHPVTEAVWGEVGITAALLLEQIAGSHSATDQRAELAKQWESWRARKRERAAEVGEHGLSSAAIFAALGEAMPEDAVIAVDVGNNTYSFGRYFECKAQSVLMSGYLGSIGFGFPAAMGAWAAVGETRKVVSISGDGGFGQYLAELTTAVKYQMNITHVLLNNSELGKISKEQRDGEWKVWQTSLHNPNFADYADLCGAKGFRVEKPEELEKAIQEALAHPGPSLVEILSDPLLT